MYAPVVLRFNTYGIDVDAAAAAYIAHVIGAPAMREWVATAKAETEIIDHDEVGV